jgi:hypothetical protein
MMLLGVTPEGSLPFVMARLDPAIHVDPRDKPGDDECRGDRT